MIKIIILTLLPIIVSSDNYFFSTTLENSEYLDNLKTNLQSSANITKFQLNQQAEEAKQAAKQFLVNKFRANLFSAMRDLAEAELTSKRVNSKFNNKNGNELNDDESEEEEDEDGEGSGESKEEGEESETKDSSSTTKPVLLQTADLLKVIFGGSGGVNGIIKTASGGKAKNDLKENPEINIKWTSSMDQLITESYERISRKKNSGDVKLDFSNDKEDHTKNNRYLSGRFLEILGLTERLEKIIPNLGDKDLFDNDGGKAFNFILALNDFQ